MNGWQNDKAWSDRFLQEIKMILGLHLIGEPEPEEDKERNTDLVVLKMETQRIGCRIRRHTYYANNSYRQQFTIRADRPSGMKTELAKIVEGWGDYFFYGFSDAYEKKLIRWTLADFNVFRLWFNTMIARNNGRIPGELISNGDGSSHFRAFRWSDLPSDFVVANWEQKTVDSQ